GHLIVRAGRDQEPAVVVRTVPVGLSGAMGVEGEAALQAPPELREATNPAAVSGEVVEVREAVARGQPLQAESGQGGRGFAEGETRGATAADEGDLVPLSRQHPGEERAGKAGAHDGDAETSQGSTTGGAEEARLDPPGRVHPGEPREAGVGAGGAAREPAGVPEVGGDDPAPQGQAALER